MEFRADGIPHRTRDLCAYDQFKLLLAVSEVLPVIMAMEAAMQGGGAQGLAKLTMLMQRADAQAFGSAFDACVASCEREGEAGWGPASKALSLSAMLDLVVRVTVENLGAYLNMAAPVFRATSRPPLEFQPVAMPDDEAWFWKPVEAGLIPFMAAYDGTAKIEHFRKANFLLLVQGENEARARKAAERH